MTTSKPAKRELATLPGLGPKSAQMLAEVGVTCFETLCELGPIECYRRLRFRFGKRVTLNFVYAMECALRDLDWRLIDEARKTELKRQAQAVSAELALLHHKG